MALAASADLKTLDQHAKGVPGIKVGDVILQQLRILNTQCLVADRLAVDTVAQ